MMKRFGALGLLAVVSGCPSPAEEELLDARDALEECDLRTAHDEFGAAFDLDATDVRASLGYALTDLVLLVEDPAITELAVAIGFDSGVDAEDFVYGPGGLFDMLANEPTCDAREAWAEANIPYQPVRNDDIYAEDLIDGAVTVDDLVASLVSLAPRFERTASALEAAAEAMDGSYLVETSDSCGAGALSTVVQPPELYGAAAVLEGLRAGIHVADAYSWDLSIRHPWDEQGGDLVAGYNTLFILEDAARMEEARLALVHAVELADAGVAAIQDTTDHPEGGFFDWTLVQGAVLLDLRLVAEAGLESLGGAGMVEIPMWSPSLEVDLHSYFASPPDAADLSKPFFRTDLDYVEVDEEMFSDLLLGGFSRDILHSDLDEEWNFSDAWDDLDLEPVLNPGGHLDAIGECD